MRLEILRTYVTLKANDHMVKPKNMTLGSFTITLDNTKITYDHDWSSSGWVNDDYVSCESFIINPEFEWCGRGGADIFYKNDIAIKDSEYHIFEDFNKLPTITSIDEVFYEAFTNINEGVEFDFNLYVFSILVIDRDTNKEYEIEASDEVIQEYINKVLEEREYSM